jgi:hypothetical protein
VHDAVEVVALPTHQLVESRTRQAFEPLVVWHLRVREVGADLVQAHEDEYEHAGNTGEQELAVVTNQQGCGRDGE